MDLKTIGSLRALITAAIVACAGATLAMGQAYQQTNLVSDIQGLAQNPPNGQADTQLLNPWGLVATTTSPWWISDNNAGLSTLYNGQGLKQGLVVNIPSPTSATAAHRQAWYLRERQGFPSRRMARQPERCSAS